MPDLIKDLAIILMIAALVSLLFKRFRQPVVLGYLLAGFLVGPHVPVLPTVSDTKSVTIWAEIGVIFLLFGLGLEFSFKKLAAVGKSASITASFEIFFMLAAGFVTGQVLGWSKMDSLFLGGILSISSTTIIVRAFDELGLKGKGFASLVFGALIVEDLIAILLMVLLTSVAVTQTLSGSELLSSSLRLVFFMVLWFLLGIYLLPNLLQRMRPLLSDESTLIVSLGLCLMMVMVASYSGFSPALGAFIMGSLLAETKDGHRIEILLLPVKDLFAAVFFVSVGMLIDPTVLKEYFWTITIISLVTIGGKILSTAIGALLSGCSLKNSVQAGMSLAQIGEFSFIIATLGVSLKVTGEFLYPVAVAVSALTTFTTPYLIKFSGPLAARIERSLPVPIKNALQRYEKLMVAEQGTGMFGLVWKEYGIKFLFNAVIVVAITLAIRKFVVPQIQELSIFQTREEIIRYLATGLALLFSGPFLWAITLGGPLRTIQYEEKIIERLRRIQLGISLFQMLLGASLVGFIVSQFTTILAFSGSIFFAFAVLVGLLFSRYSAPLYQIMEARFISNLSESERAALEKKGNLSELAPWDAVMVEFVMSPHSALMGKTLGESAFRDRFGVTVAMIQRGNNRIIAPGKDERLMPFDRLSLIGTEDQIPAAGKAIEGESMEPQSLPAEAFGLVSLVMDSESKYLGVPIRESGIREAVNGLVVGIERAGLRILNPDPGLSLSAGDLVWIVGEKAKVRALRNGMA